MHQVTADSDAVLSRLRIPRRGLTEPVIVGSRRYVRAVRRALALLRERVPQGYFLVLRHIGRIEQGRYTCAILDSEPPVAVLGEQAVFAGSTKCASALVHEAYHLALHQERQLQGTGSPTFRRSRTAGDQIEEEKACFSMEVKVLQRLGAPSGMIRWLERQDGTHCLRNPEDDPAYLAPVGAWEWLGRIVFGPKKRR